MSVPFAPYTQPNLTVPLVPVVPVTDGGLASHVVTPLPVTNGDPWPRMSTVDIDSQQGQSPQSQLSTPMVALPPFPLPVATDAVPAMVPVGVVPKPVTRAAGPAPQPVTSAATGVTTQENTYVEPASSAATPVKQETNAEPTMTPNTSMKKTWQEWMEQKIKIAKQVVQEKFGQLEATTDQELTDRVDQLLATQAAYRNVLRLATAFNEHLFGMVQAQKHLAASFSELAVHQPDLYEQFTKNHDSQKALYKNGAALLGTLKFFTDNMQTLVFTTIEDTLSTWNAYQAVRLEFDAEKQEILRLKHQTQDEAKITHAQERFRTLETQFAAARESVEAKLELLEGNKVRVMHKQLELFNGAMVAYFSGNKEALDKILSDSFIQSLDVDLDKPKSQTWLEKLHDDVATKLAPELKKLTTRPAHEASPGP
eukprot:m.572617 g.572617  ORF g.572617 m.572617 type:complete len:425 (-) comp22273_c1_seq1:1694-2968(-)